MRIRPAVALVLALGTTLLLVGGAWLYLYSATTGLGRSRPVEQRNKKKLGLPSCLSNADCAEGTYCTYPYAGHPDPGCFADKCQPGGCGPYFACRVTVGPYRGRGARFCLLAGTQQEGQPCIERPHQQGEGCLRELICIDQVCRRPCDPKQPAACAPGLVCEDSLNGPICVPS